MATKELTAKQQALKDIKAELKREEKVFIAFRSELNPIMRKIISEYLKSQKQEKKSSYCLSTWTIKKRNKNK